MCLRMGALGYLSAQSLEGLEIEVSYVDSQRGLHDQAPVKLMDTY